MKLEKAYIPNVEYYAWTGGSTPPPYSERTLLMKTMTSTYFKSNMKIHINYWGRLWEGLSSARVIYKRAVYDAWATLRRMA